MAYYTAIIVPQGEQLVAQHMMTSHVLVVENYGNLGRVLRGRGVNKVILVGLRETELNEDLRDTLRYCGISFRNETGAEVPYVEV